MFTVVVYVVATLVVAAALFALSVVVFGRGELLPAVDRGHTVTALPADEISGDDLRDVRFGMAPRGYTMAEVDWVLDQAAEEIDRLRGGPDRTERAPTPSHDLGGEGAPASPDDTTR